MKEKNVVDKGSLLDRMKRALILDPDLYKEVISDTTALNSQALTAVAIASLANGFGVGFAAVIIEGGLGFFGGLLVGLLTALGGWLIWYVCVQCFGDTIFKEPDSKAGYGGIIHRGLIITLGFSNSPRVLTFFYFIPYIGWIIALIASVWTLIAGIQAVSATLPLTHNRAVATCVAGWIPYMLLVFLFAGLTV